MNKIAIRRGSTVVLELPLDDKAVYSSQVMGEEYVETTLSVGEALQLQVGDRLLHNGVEFVLFEEPDHTHRDGVHSYPIRFYAPYYVFGFVKHKHRGATDITYCGTLEEHVAMLFSDVQQAGTGSGSTSSCYTGFRVEWGAVDKTAVQNIEFGDVTCLEALAKLCETYGLEYRFSGKSLYLAAADQAADPDAAWPSFEYGRGKGLYALERQGISNESIVTRLYVYGSDRNLPADYRKNDNPRPVRLTIAGRHIDANTARYGVREQTLTNDEIYPCLKGVRVTGTPRIAGKTCTFRIRFANAADAFELSGNVIKDREPKVSFTTGALTGEEFGIVKGGWRKIDSTTREIDIVRSEIEYEGATHYLPSDERLPAEGDEFVLLDLNMPAQYVTRAETELREWGRRQLEKKSERQYSYRLEIDPRHVKRQGLRLAAGDRIRVTDEGVARILRISRVSYPLAKPAQLSVELNDIRVGTFAEKVEKEIKDMTGAVKEVHRQTGAVSRRAWRDAREVADLVDALTAPGLLTGDAEGQFTCTSVIRCNVEGNPNKIAVSDGALKHALYAPAGNSEWKITGGETLLDDTRFPLGKPLFLYAVCATGNNSAYVAAAPEAPSEEQTADRYFRIGVLSSAYETTAPDGTSISRRTVNYTYRYSQIVGGNITTSVISDPARRLVIDLDNARIEAAEGARITGRIDLTNSTLGDKTIIDGGRIKADSIDTDNLTVKQLQTSENADKRIVISKKDHNITMYNEQDQLRLEISGERKENLTDIIDTGGDSTRYITLQTAVNASAQAFLAELTTEYTASDEKSNTYVACGPFTIRGSVKPSLQIPPIQPVIKFEDSLETHDFANASASFSVVIEKQDDTGAWKTHIDLGTYRKTNSGKFFLQPLFYRGTTIHNIVPGTYRIVCSYSMECQVDRFIKLDGNEFVKGEEIIGGKTGNQTLQPAAITPITPGIDLPRTTVILPGDDVLNPNRPVDSLKPVEPVKPIEPPEPFDPVLPPITLKGSRMKVTLSLYNVSAHLEYSIERTSIFANGMASVWAKEKYFRILDGSETNLIETRGTTQMLSQNSYHGLQITDSGLLVRYQNGPWSGLMPGVDYIGHVNPIGSFKSQWRAPGKSPMNINKLKEGNYRVTFNTGYTYDNEYIVLVSSFYGYGRMLSRSRSECVLFLADDASANDAEFYFIVLNVKNYLS